MFLSTYAHYRTSTEEPATDQQLKARHRALWASGGYPAVAVELIPTLGSTLVEACGVRAGQRVLDVAVGRAPVLDAAAAEARRLNSSATAMNARRRRSSIESGAGGSASTVPSSTGSIVTGPAGSGGARDASPWC